MIFLYVLIALWIGWIWIDYFSQISIFKSKYLLEMVIIFAAGAISSEIVSLLPRFVLDGLTGEFGKDLGYSIIEIGLVEEIIKLLPFFVAVLFFKSRLKSPMDYIQYACISAMGFSAMENIMYFTNYGSDVIIGRSILAALGHVCDSSLAIYGFVLVRFHKKFAKNYFMIPMFIALAAISHGFYDFWLIFDGAEAYGWLITILYFFVTVSIFATILNNALNNSDHFSFHKVVDSALVLKRLMVNYAIVFGLTFVLMLLTDDFSEVIVKFLLSICYIAFIIVVCCIRLSRFKLIPNRWNAIKFELPFSITSGNSEFRVGSQFHIRVKGESFNESRINKFYEHQFYVYPVSKGNSTIKSRLIGTIKAKHFLENDTTYYEGHLPGYLSDIVLLRPKTSGKTEVNEKYPIVAILRPVERINWTGRVNKKQAFKFVEWVYLVPMQS